MPDSKVLLSRFLHYFFLFFLCVVVCIFIAEFNPLGTAVTLGFTCLQNRFNLWRKFIGQHFHWFLCSSCLVSTLNSNRKRGEIYTSRKKVEFHPLVIPLSKLRKFKQKIATRASKFAKHLPSASQVCVY